MSFRLRRTFRAFLPLGIIVGVALGQTLAVHERPISNVAKCVTLSAESPAALAGVLLGPGPAP